jgi:hypothetical protein
VEREKKERCCGKKRCLYQYMEQILESEGERQREREGEGAVVKTNGYGICRV